MTDFETRARAAARAIHAAIDQPASTEPVSRRSRGPVRAIAVAAVVIVIAIVGTTVVVETRSDRTATAVTGFCAALRDEMAHPAESVTNETNGETSPNRDPHAQDYLLDAPPEIHDTAQRLHDALAAGKQTDRADSTALLNWFELRCFPDAAQPGAPADQQRFAPLPAPPGLDICSAANRNPADPAADRARNDAELTIYGDSALPDPYVAPMIGIASAHNQSLRGDGTETPIVLPGHPDAAIGPMSSAFSNRIDGSQAITWSEGGRTVAVFGRSYGPDRTDQLVAIAGQVTMAGGRPRVALKGLLTGFRQLYRGSLLDTSPVVIASNPSSTFSLIGNAGNLQIGATVMWEGGDGRYDAIRFFAPAITPTTVSGRAVLIGSFLGTTPNDPRQPQLARWSPGGGVVLTALSLPGTTRSPVDLRAVIAATTKLHRAEWEAIISHGDGCFAALQNGRSAAASGSASSSATTNPTTSATTARPAQP